MGFSEILASEHILIDVSLLSLLQLHYVAKNSCRNYFNNCCPIYLRVFKTEIYSIETKG